MGRGIIGARGDSRARTLLNKHGDIRREEGIVRISYREAQTAHKRHGLKRAKNACFGGKKREKRSHREHNRLKHSTTEKSNISHRLEVSSEIRDSRAKNFPTRRVPSVCEACSIGLRGVPLDTSEHSVSKPAENSVNKKSSRSDTSYTVPRPIRRGATRPARDSSPRPFV